MVEKQNLGLNFLNKNKKKKKQNCKEKAGRSRKKAKEEEEEKRRYDTGISFEQLARTPDEFKGKKVKFSGEVLQVMENDGEVRIRLAVNNDYSAIVYGVYDSSIVSSRILEEDYITIMGLSGGLYSYESTSGAQVTIPLIYVDKIEN